MATIIPRSIACATGKGGVGKTMLAASIGASWARKGLRTLLVDCDGQASATLTLGIDPGDHGRGRQLVDAVMYQEPLKPVPSPGRPGLDVIPAGINTRHLVTWLAAENRADELFSASFESAANQYDRLLFDCPPSVAGSRLAESVLATVQYIVSPCTDQMNDIEGLRVLGDVMEACESSAVVLGVVLVRISASATRAQRTASEQIAEVVGSTDDVYTATVRLASAAWRMSQEENRLPWEAAQAAEAEKVDIRARIAGEQKPWPANLRALADDLEAVADETDRRLNLAEQHLAHMDITR